ncbi:hypothetical protein FJT64_014919 [Amphibalanus amphitrite]|uniref:Uncharacterized protein n=1 Tax=Amphibalanus amphitrite TaxID=1232801 RepID=A0A6A4X610_AMPAM|nr:hypothetical protein FJT64_014919 [Amphibalanus amphitrite]
MSDVVSDCRRRRGEEGRGSDRRPGAAAAHLQTGQRQLPRGGRPARPPSLGHAGQPAARDPVPTGDDVIRERLPGRYQSRDLLPHSAHVAARLRPVFLQRSRRDAQRRRDRHHRHRARCLDDGHRPILQQVGQDPYVGAVRVQFQVPPSDS